MKILFISTYYPPEIAGGAELSLQQIVLAMQSQGFEVVVAATDAKENSFRKENQHGVYIYRCPIKNTYWTRRKELRNIKNYQKMYFHLKDMYNFSMKNYVKNIIEQEKPDVVSCHNLVGWSPAIYDTIKSFGLPIVQVLHDLYFTCKGVTMFKEGHNCEKQCTSCYALKTTHKILSRKADFLVGISNSILDKVKREDYFTNVPYKRVFNLRTIAYDETIKNEEKDVFTIGFLGALVSTKGIEWLIEEFKRVNLPIKLLIGGVGSPSYIANLKEKSSGYNIEFLGYVKSNEFFRKIDLLVVPSLWEEPLGMVAVESCAYEVPVIANSRGGLKEIITNNENGLLCDDADTNSLGNALVEIFSNKELYHNLKSNTRKSVEVFLNQRRLAQEYFDVYTNVISKV